MSETEKQKKGAASFWIPRKAIDALLQANATATEIAAYLILAKHTQATGDYSTAGIKAVRTRAGTGVKQAQAAVEALLNITTDGRRTKSPETGKALKRLIYTADDWLKRTGEILPHGPGKLSKIRFVLNTMGNGGKADDDAVWFGANLVAGIGGMDRPLFALRQCGDRAAWLLLLLYAHNAMDEWGGINPTTTLYGIYKETHRETVGRTPYSVAHWKLESNTAFWNLIEPVVSGLWNNSEERKERAQDIFWPAVNALESRGFLYEMVTVATARPNTDHPREGDFPLYELDARSLHGYKPEGEEGVGGETATIARDLGYPVTDGEGHFFGKYAAVFPTGTPIRVLGVYRLRFRVANPKNATIAEAWQQIRERQREARGWITDLRKRAHLPEPVKADPPEEQA